MPRQPGLLLGALLASALIVLSGCEPFEGRLVLSTALEVMPRPEPFADDDDLAWPWESEPAAAGPVRLQPGRYDARLTFTGRRSATLTVRSGSAATAIELEAPRGSTLLRAPGPFRLSAEPLGQPWAVEGDLATEVNESEPRRGFEPCTYEAAYPVCREDRCYWRSFLRSGRRFVRFIYRITTNRVELTFVEPGSGQGLGSFDGMQTLEDRVYLERGLCR
jgi:hypothetical protein